MMRQAALAVTATVLAALSSAALAAGAADDPLTRPIASPYAAGWNRPQTPMRIFGDSYYVGVGGLSSVLIRTDDGLILIDGALPQSVAAIEAHIRQLGFRVEDIRYILNTEAHFDHSGGLAALARDSGATVVASPAGARALRQGRVTGDDPQAGDIDPFPAVGKVRSVADGESVRLGRTAVTAHFTPGHTPGSTSWSWTSCEGVRCLNLVFAASLNPVAAGGFHFGGGTGPDLTASYRASIAKVAGLPCDILISAHPDHSGFDARLARAQAGDADPFVDRQACRAYADKYGRALDARLARERTVPADQTRP